MYRNTNYQNRGGFIPLLVGGMFGYAIGANKYQNNYQYPYYYQRPIYYPYYPYYY